MAIWPCGRDGGSLRSHVAYSLCQAYMMGACKQDTIYARWLGVGLASLARSRLSESALLPCVSFKAPTGINNRLQEMLQSVTFDAKQLMIHALWPISVSFYPFLGRAHFRSRRCCGRSEGAAAAAQRALSRPNSNTPSFAPYHTPSPSLRTPGQEFGFRVPALWAPVGAALGVGAPRN